MFSKIVSHKRYISRYIYLAVEQEMETFGEKEEKGKVQFLISLDISQSRYEQNTPLLMQEEEEEDALYVS